MSLVFLLIVGCDFYTYGYYDNNLPLARPSVRFKERRGNLERRGDGKVNGGGIH